MDDFTVEKLGRHQLQQVIKANILGVEREHDFYGILLGMPCLCLVTRKHQQTQLRFKLWNGRWSERVETGQGGGSIPG